MGLHPTSAKIHNTRGKLTWLAGKSSMFNRTHILRLIFQPVMLVFGKVHEDVIQSAKKCFPNTLWYSMRLVAPQNLWNFWNFTKYHFFGTFQVSQSYVQHLDVYSRGASKFTVVDQHVVTNESLCSYQHRQKLSMTISHRRMTHAYSGNCRDTYIHGVCSIPGYTTWQVLNPQVVAHLLINSLRKNMPILWLNQPDLEEILNQLVASRRVCLMFHKIQGV